VRRSLAISNDLPRYGLERRTTDRRRERPLAMLLSAAR
jgi:hypothetical protein